MSNDKESNPHELDETGAYLNDSAPEVVSLLDEYLRQLRSGQSPDRDEFLARYPEHAEELRACLDSLEFLTRERDDLQTMERIGDFRIIREIGRGGMGTVYEAEQISLRRRVALKIVRAGLQSADSIERFRREAKMVAALHHTNIVPIFSVGVENDINYFAMEYIDGTSLAEVCREADTPLDSAQVARWGLDAVEALAHAHDQGIVHRDVKPSNLLLEKSGRLWLSDFGLAKRSDDLTLSVTGTVLGTPRYMSPEQARGATDDVDERSDIYGVGATLYELATKTPVFDAESPHKIISQIIHDEPESPRSRANDIPADFETILLKCLEKQPSDRYQSANDLAVDLRAFLEDRPISARRASVVEQGKRWIRRQRTSLPTTALIAASTVLIALLGWAFESWRQLAREVDYRFASTVPGTVIEFLDANDQPVREPITLPNEEIVSLRRNKLKLRATAPGRFSQTRMLEVDPLSQFVHTDLVQGERFDMDAHHTIPPIEYNGELSFSREPGRCFVVDATGIACRDVVNGKSLWHSPPHAWGEIRTQYKNFQWPWGEGSGKIRPRVVHCDDLDGDGVAEVVLMPRHQAWLVCLSGNTGECLWVVNDQIKRGYETGECFGECLLLPDINDDGVKELVVHARMQPDPHFARRLVTLSGLTGEVLSMYEQPGHFDEHRSVGSPQLVQLPDADPMFAFALGRELITMDPKRDVVVARFSMPEPLLLPPMFRELRGDGTIQCMTTYQFKNKSNVFITADIHPIASLGLTNGDNPISETTKPVVRQFLSTGGASHAVQDQEGWPLERWPLVVDLDANGTSEIIMPWTQGEGSPGSTWNNSSHIQVCNPLNASRKWWKELRHCQWRVGNFVPGPDIDLDGVRELFTASLWVGEIGKLTLCVDALSGANGESLWSRFQELTVSDPIARHAAYKVVDLVWHANDHLERGLISVSIRPTEEAKISPAMTYFFSTASGRVAHVARDVVKTESRDVTGDGSRDIVLHQQPARRSSIRKVFFVAHGIEKTWRSSANTAPLVIRDLDGDEVGDLLQQGVKHAVRAVSGRTGEIIWERKPVVANAVTKTEFAVPDDGFDADRDGVQDFLLFPKTNHVAATAPITTAVSGATGAVLWQTSQTVAEFRQVHALKVKDLDQDGTAELILVAQLRFGRGSFSIYSEAATGTRLALVVMDGETGEVKWKADLSPMGDSFRYVEEERPPNYQDLEIAFVDVTSDGVLDVVAPLKSPTGPFQLQVFDGKTGVEQWSTKPALTEHNDLQLLPQLAIADLKHSGDESIVVTEFDETTATAKVTAYSKSSLQRWQWTQEVSSNVFKRLSKQPRHWLRPVVLTGPNERSIALDLPGQKRDTVIVLDCNGKKTSEHQAIGSERGVDLRVLDVDGDSYEELVYFDADQLRVSSLANGQLKKRWSQRFEVSLDPFREPTLEILATDSKRNDITIVNHATNSRVIGFDAQNGQRRWTSPLDFANGRQRVMLLAGDSERPPCVAQSLPTGELVVREVSLRSLELDAATETAQTEHQAGFAKYEPRRDPRLRRTLRWARESHNRSWLRTAPREFAYGVGLYVSLIAFPLYLLRRLRRGRWSMRLVLLMPVCAAGILLQIITYRDVPFAQKMLGALVLIPVVQFYLCLFNTVWNKRWGIGLAWFAVTVGCTLTYGYLMYLASGRIAENEYLDYTGWHVALWVGVWFTGLLMLVAESVAKGIRRSPKGSQISAAITTNAK